MYSGRCECGSVRFTVPSVRETVSVCHCSQCRRTSGHLWAGTIAPAKELQFQKDEGLKWYASSENAKRGFCQHCGSSLFFWVNGDAAIGIAAGCLDETGGMTVSKHIFAADKGAYYEITDGKPVFAAG